MKIQLLLISICAAVAAGSVIPATPTYHIAGIPTAHSSQVFVRNYGRYYVPGYVPTAVVPNAAYPTYAGVYPTTNIYRYGTSYPYGYYPAYGYGYSSYGGTLW
ncbi:uncharacterized protein LOC119672965 [Teleopsis dalmanni]|uniref:uncharacterized protein LOC119672965 n=1 Tax=Teleopsis dalmanni TaxID=139649 RepID=UPI0018CE5766|nr:uncharacterized protein LOC119672965 [Teleopsis dalmanni]